MNSCATCRLNSMLWEPVWPWLSSLESPAHPVKSLTSTCPAPGAHSNALMFAVEIGAGLAAGSASLQARPNSNRRWIKAGGNVRRHWQTALLACPEKGKPEQGGESENSSLIAASDCAPAAVISINGHGPTATTVPSVIGIIVIDPASVMALTITGAANVYPNTARPDVHTLSQGWCRSPRSHRASESERN
jgi:hypothetical protein